MPSGPSAEPDAVSEVTFAGPLPATAALAELRGGSHAQVERPGTEGPLDREFALSSAKTEALLARRSNVIPGLMPSAGFRSNSVIFMSDSEARGEASRLDGRDRKGGDGREKGGKTCHDEFPFEDGLAVDEPAITLRPLRIRRNSGERHARSPSELQGHGNLLHPHVAGLRRGASDAQEEPQNAPARFRTPRLGAPIFGSARGGSAPRKSLTSRNSDSVLDRMWQKHDFLSRPGGAWSPAV